MEYRTRMELRTESTQLLIISRIIGDMGQGGTWAPKLRPGIRTGARCLLWGSDHPHPEGTFPHSQAAVAEQLEDTPKEIADAVLWRNAAELYGFDTPPGA